MGNINISWLFYKEYFQGMNFSEIDHAENINLIKFKNKKISDAPLKVLDNTLAKQLIHVIVQYPGLVTGIGINHEASIKGEFKLGIHFDYTYGMPVIYGSSVKGLLRSAFPEKNEEQKLRDCKIKQIRDYFGHGFERLDIDSLREQIFDGIKERKKNIVAGKEIEQIVNFSIYERDVFFDAVIIDTNKKDKFLASDSITPHKEALKSPTPLTFLKIASGVKLEFRFDLKDYKENDVVIVTKEQKRDLFKQILLDFGIGAKTNVGYGQFKDEKR
jgi:CRISPR-associated protein Cmr6